MWQRQALQTHACLKQGKVIVHDAGWAHICLGQWLKPPAVQTLGRERGQTGKGKLAAHPILGNVHILLRRGSTKGERVETESSNENKGSERERVLVSTAK